MISLIFWYVVYLVLRHLELGHLHRATICTAHSYMVIKRFLGNPCSASLPIPKWMQQIRDKHLQISPKIHKLLCILTDLPRKQYLTSNQISHSKLWIFAEHCRCQITACPTKSPIACVEKHTSSSVREVVEVAIQEDWLSKPCQQSAGEEHSVWSFIHASQSFSFSKWWVHKWLGKMRKKLQQFHVQFPQLL